MKNKFLLKLIVLICGATLAGCNVSTKRQIALFFSGAKPQITNLSAKDGVRLINDQPDYGFDVMFDVTNEGQSGMIKLQPWMSGSEGEWSREQILYLDANESRRFSYFFHEPTVNVTNIQYGAQHTP